MDHDKNTPVLQHGSSLDGSNHVITGTRCVLANGLEIAIVVVSQTVGDIDEFTTIDSPHALSLQTMYEDRLVNKHADKLDKNGLEEGEIR
jgi:hypothetical protein